MSLFPAMSLLQGFSFAVLVLFIGSSFFFVYLFIRKWLQEPVKKIKDTRILWVLLIISFALQQLFFLIEDFFAPSYEYMFWCNLAYISVGIGLVIFVAIQEEALPFNTHGLITVASAVLFAILLLVPRNYQTIFAVILVIFYAVLFATFARFIIKVSTSKDKLNFCIFIVGFFVFTMGELFKASLFFRYSFLFYPIGAFFILIGSLIANSALYNLSSFTDIGWNRKIREIYIVHESGLPILHVTFENGKPKVKHKPVESKILFASGVLTGIKSALKEITQTKRDFLFVDQGDIKLIFGGKEQVLVTVVTEKNINIIYRKIKEFLNEFYPLFSSYLKTPPSDISVFEPGYYLIQKYFSE
ncbi:MAG: hypothetical protein J7L47_10950 [Candidatus Odinarchaeota archaeon]|nr:hypothetical protein [Candidatus Odinarchaeota archaeon]